MAAMFMLLLLVFLPLVHGSSADCSYGQIRLVNGTAPNEGLVEICINNTWGTVCDDLWSDSNAQVVCRQLGYSANGSMSAYFGTGHGQIFLDDVDCDGFESSLLHCSHNFIGTHDCTHAQDIGVTCSNCSYGDLRLINGTLPNEGRVEICIDNTWGTVCDRNWTNASANVVCKQLGYNTTGAVYSFFGGGNGDIFVNGVNCIGFENTLLQCEHNLTNLTESNCTHQDDVGVICFLSGCYDGQLRLVNGTVPNEGRLEICYNNAWGTVCDNRWTNIIADVACGQLGYSNTGAVYRFNNAFGRGNGSVILDFVKCRGFERSLLHCVHSVIGDTFCSHYEQDVGIICLDIDPSNNETLCSTRLDNELWNTMSAQGKCEPYIDSPWFNPSVCDSIYTNLHYVYTPNARLLGQPYVRLLMENITANFAFTSECYESVVNALCMLYYLPCGYNGTIQVPRFLCSDACTNVSTQMCSGNWDALRTFIINEFSGDQVLKETIVMPNCSHIDSFIEAFNLDSDCCEPFYQPGPVYNLMASDVTNASVKLSWSFDPPVTGGVVSYAAIFNGFGNGTLSFTGGNVMEQIIFNLEPFTVYNFNVTLLNTFGGRSGSKVTINTVTLPNVPTAPTLISAVSINLTSIAVSWSINIDSSRQSDVELYTVMYYTEGQQNNELNVTVPANIVTINGLAEKRNYSVTVSATNSAGKSASSNSITVQTNSYGCNTETTVSIDRGTFEWPVTVSGSIANVSCPSGPTGTNATRICTNDNTWESPNITSCATTRISNEFRNISNVSITAENVVSVSENLTDLLAITTDPADQNNNNIQVVSVILKRTATLLSDPTALLSLSSSELSMTTENIVQVLDTVEEWSINVVETESNNIINSFEGIIDALINQENFTNITVVEDDIALLGQRFQQSKFSGTVFTAASFNNALKVEIKENNTNGLNINETASVELPQNIANIVENDNIDLAFTLYDKSVLFPIREPPPNTIVGSSVVGARISGVTDGTKLPDRVVVNLALKRTENITNPRCVYWDFNAAGGRGNWSTDGCNTTVNATNGHIACHCDHLTNFACLVDVSARSTGSTQAPKYFTITLEAVSIVGVCLSIVGLALTIITLTIFKKLRAKETSKFHIQLCLSLILMLIVFVAGIDRVSVRAGCITVGVLIHYFALVAWMWMGAEALLMFQKLVIVFSNITWKYLLAVSIICWTLPLLPVVITLAVDHGFYIYLYENGNQSGFCFINNIIPFLAAFLLPVLIILIFNGVIYILIIRVSVLHTVEKNKRMRKASLTKSEILRMMLSYSGILILFGLTWLFAVFTFISEPNVSFIVQFFFAFCNTFQGFFIFIFFVILSSDSRNTWISLLCPRKVRKGKTSLTSTAAKTKSSNVKVTSPVEKKPNKYENETLSNGKESMHLEVEKQNENLIFRNKTILEDEILSADDEFMISEFNGIRFERCLSTRRKHHIEKIEIDFFDVDNASLISDDDRN